MRQVQFPLAFSLCIAIAVILWHPTVMAQSNAPRSLGEAARRVREQKKNAPKHRVWTNEDVDSLAGGVSIVGPATEPAPNPEGEAAKPAAATGEDEEKELKEKQAELAEAKEQLKRVEKELDLAQRDFALSRQQYYSNPGYASDSAGKAALEGLRGEINAKQEEAEKTKAKIAALEKKIEELRRKSESSKQASPPAEK